MCACVCVVWCVCVCVVWCGVCVCVFSQVRRNAMSAGNNSAAAPTNMNKPVRGNVCAWVGKRLPLIVVLVGKDCL